MAIITTRRHQIFLSDLIAMVAIPALGALLIRAYGLLDGSTENIYLLAVFSVIPGAVAALRWVNRQRIAGFLRLFNLVFIMTFFLGTGVVLAHELDIDLRNRIMANQSAAVASCKAYAEGQEMYRRNDWNNDCVYEYASTVSVMLPSDPLLIDPIFARAEGLPGAAKPKTGYVFKVLTAQGPHAAGGAKDFIVRGHMTEGYALVACPDVYGGTGRLTYMISYMGTIFEKDLGPATPQTMAQMVAFDPDSSWTVTE